MGVPLGNRQPSTASPTGKDIGHHQAQEQLIGEDAIWRQYDFISNALNIQREEEDVKR